jgi:hypothetical protein
VLGKGSLKPTCTGKKSNSTILLPDAEESRDSIFSDLAQLESQAKRGIVDDSTTPITFPSLI